MTIDSPEGHEIERRGTLIIIEGGAYSPRELSVARLLAQRGYHVVLRPPIGTRLGGETSDLLLNGRGYDIYTPTTVNPDWIISAIAKKNAQAEGVVLDLSATSVTRPQLGNILERIRGAGAMNIRDVIVLEEK
jgi:filamentous hemagglutinin